jgi:HEPN domain-containing protein
VLGDRVVLLEAHGESLAVEDLLLGYPVSMGGRAADWFRQAEADLRHARRALEDGACEWACFAAQQAAEKAAKGAHDALGQEAWGHVVTELLESLRPREPSIDDALLDRARALDKLYIPTQYPNGLAGGAPTDFYTRPEAERAIADGEAVLAVCRNVLSRQ